MFAAMGFADNACKHNTDAEYGCNVIYHSYI